MNLPSQAEVVIVGAGPAGSAAAHRLAEAGAEVVLLERGVSPKSLTEREAEMLPQLRLDGMTTTITPGLMLESGTGPGGGSVMSMGVCQRIPSATLSRWGGFDALDPAYDNVEALLGVSDIPESAINENNALFLRGGRAMSYRMTRLRDNREGCIGAGFCALGCARKARTDARRILLPGAQAHGATLIQGAQVTAIEVRRGRIQGVEGVAAGERFFIRADRVILAAGAVVSSMLATRVSRGAGQGLFFHPTARVLGLFPEPVVGWQGIPQSVACTQLHDDGIRLSPSSDHPATLAGWLPGSTEARAHLMGRLRNLALCEVAVADDATGRVRNVRGRPRVDYQLSERTGAALARGVTEAARLWMAAGARRVVVPWAEPAMLNTLADAELLRGIPPGPGDPLVSRWPGGGLAIGTVCDGSGQLDGITGLYAADTALLPEATAIPPILTAYALGWMVAGLLTGQ
ncbi:MAG: choline dehydrogenase-like flavoprotein [Myxococcota bacterium]|jgi:choline dehydrogenase-like flavoprotein